MAITIINDIIEGKFNKKYLINYTPTLLKKKRKNAQILNIIADATIQEKLILKVTYEGFLKNKYEIYDLIKKGYRFAIIVENENDIDNTNLNMFKFIIVAGDNPKLEKYISKLKNIIILSE